MLTALILIPTLTALVRAHTCPAGSLPANQFIRWSPCPVDTVVNGRRFTASTLECATIEVPLDYINASSESLTIPLVRVPSNSSTPLNKTIITNPGGPGVSGIKLLIQAAEQWQSISGDGYHLLSFDPRGVGLTVPFKCPSLLEIGPTIENHFEPYDTIEGLNASYIYNTAQGDVCSQPAYFENGQFINTAFVARDINAISEALGEDGFIRYWGYSYGTLLGSTLAAMFPNSIDRMVLDGNVNPTDYYHGLGDESVADTDAALSYFFDTCAQTGPALCPLARPSVSGQTLEAEFWAWMNNLKNGTYKLLDQEVSSGVSWFLMKTHVFHAMYKVQEWPLLARYINSSYTNTTKTSAMVKREESFNLTEILNVNLPLSIYGIKCGEWDPFSHAATLSDFRNLLDIYQNRSILGGSEFVNNAFACATWNIKAKEIFEGSFENITTRNSILFVNTNKDPVTPLVSALNSSSGFMGSAVLRSNGGGHCSNSDPSTCVNEKVRSYWITGVIPDTSEICEPDSLPFPGPVNSSIESGILYDNDTEEVRLRNAVVDLARLDHKASEEDRYFASIIFPLELLRAKRSVENGGIIPRQATATALCTPMTAVTPSSTASAIVSPYPGGQNIASKRSYDISSIIGLVLVIWMLLSDLM